MSDTRVQMMDDLIEQMAEALWKETPIADDRSHPRYRRMARAVLAAIAAHPRYELVELPEPDSTRYDEGEGAEFPPADRLAWLRDMGYYGVTYWPECPNEVQVAYNNEPGEPLSVGESRQFAAALLAAAKAAEEAQ